MLHVGLIHADPHPGNFVVMDDGQLGILDFGSVKRFSPRFVETNRRMFLDAVEGRSLDVLQICRDVGFTLELELEDERAEPLIREVLHIAGRPLRSEDYDYAACAVARDTKAFVAKNLTQILKIRPPAEAVLFFRATGGCSQNLRQLGARGNFRAAWAALKPVSTASRPPAPCPPGHLAGTP
jgi:predicted unusual protein kinase regulating ubiquinone biosynthesis (AarF/ABC1/UbiB family)